MEFGLLIPLIAFFLYLIVDKVVDYRRAIKMAQINAPKELEEERRRGIEAETDRFAAENELLDRQLGAGRNEESTPDK